MGKIASNHQNKKIRRSVPQVVCNPKAPGREKENAKIERKRDIGSEKRDTCD